MVIFAYPWPSRHKDCKKIKKGQIFFEGQLKLKETISPDLHHLEFTLMREPIDLSLKAIKATKKPLHMVVRLFVFRFFNLC